MAFTRRGAQLGADIQIGTMKHQLYNVVLGLYMLSVVPYVLLGPWYALSVTVAGGYGLTKLLRLLLWRHW